MEMPILRKEYDFILHEEPYTIDDKIYHVGDEIVFEVYNDYNKQWKTNAGIVCFEEYEDSEGNSHFGVFIKYNIHESVDKDWDDGYDIYTLPDFLALIYSAQSIDRSIRVITP
jgi:hypothetical protein